MPDKSTKSSKPPGPVTAGLEAAPLAGYSIVSNLAGTAAHDLNNILTGVLGNIELMQRRARRQGNTEFNDYLEGAVSAATRGIDFAQSLLAIAGHQLLEPQSHITANATAQLRAELLTILPPSATLSLICPANLPDIACDLAKLSEHMRDLAALFCAQYGADKLTLSAAHQLITGALCGIMALPAGDYLALSLQHNGKGMDAEAACHAFEPYFTSKNPDGIVLAKLLGFARQSTGHAFIASPEAGQFKITLMLPAANLPA